MQFLAHQPTTPVEQDFAEMDFTPEQIARLNCLREGYPFIEWSDTCREWDALLFLRWRSQMGHVSA